MEHYILQGKRVIPVGMMEWAMWLEENPERRVVKSTETELHWISTVFVGLNMQYGSGPPLLFETMVFSRETYPRKDFFGLTRAEPIELHESYDCYRWSTWDEAVEGHDRLVREWAERETSASLFVLRPKKEEAGK